MAMVRGVSLLFQRTYYNLTAAQAQNAIKMGMVFRNEDGSKELKNYGCTDFYFDVGTFQVSLSNPDQNSTTILIVEMIYLLVPQILAAMLIMF
jgi:hypothetical protein